MVWWTVAAEMIESSCGGFEIIGALALHLGWARHTAEMIVQERERFRRTAAYRGERVWRDREGRNRQGQFTGAYNRRAEICAQPARQCAGTLLRLQLPASHAG